MLRLLVAVLIALSCFAQETRTYAEKLGWQKGDRVLILHTDDAGMSYDTNAGVRQVVERGVAKSLSVMMACPWVPDIVRYIKSHPEVDAGLHLTLTSEWRDYRWGPLAGVTAVPGLVDSEGALWRSVKEVVAHANADEVDREIRAQLDRAVKMGFQPTHLDSHMGTLFATPAFLEKYVRLGIEKQIPIMMPGGHNTYLQADMPGDRRLTAVRRIGEQLWNAGLPVLDDLHNTSYGWKMPPGAAADDRELQKWRTDRYIETLDQLQPGVTMVIMHSTDPGDTFAHISDSRDIRKADMLAMVDPRLHAFLKDKGFILTTWRELMERRRQVK